MAPLFAFITAFSFVLGLGTGVSAQQCYYPNGELTTVDAPCPNSDLCCPLGWQCLSNGLCYDPTNHYYERRTCADSTWESEDCPDFCTYSDAGNEAILWCTTGRYCCDGNRVSFDCCDGELPPGTDYFILPRGEVVGSITSMGPAPTSSVRDSSSSSSSEDETTSTSSPAATSTPRFSQTDTTSASDTTTTSASSSSSLSSSTARTASTASNGTIFEVPIETAQPDKSPGSDNSFSSSAIIGLAIGVSVLLILCALMLCLLYRRHKKNKLARITTYSQAPSYSTEIKYSDALAPGTHAPEIDSSPKATTGGTSELYGSDASNLRNSTVSSMTTGPQGYSPTSMVSPVVSTGGGSGGVVGGVPGRMGQIEEKDEPPPVELWGGHVYRPYRPGLEGQGGYGSAMQGQGSAPACGNEPAFGNAQPYHGT